MDYVTTIPVIDNAYFTRNPVGTRETVTLYVVVSEKQIVLEPEVYLTNEFYSGEV